MKNIHAVFFGNQKILGNIVNLSDFPNPKKKGGKTTGRGGGKLLETHGYKKVFYDCLALTNILMACTDFDPPTLDTGSTFYLFSLIKNFHSGKQMKND